MNIIDRIKELFSGKKAEEEKPQPKSPDQYTWPEDRALILELLDSSNDFRARSLAVTLLPYPEDRERIIRIAKEDRDDFVRDYAIEKLRYPDDREVLISLAESEPGYRLVKRAVEMLPWPEEKAFLEALAHSEEESFAKYAAMVVMAQGGVCPVCGREIKHYMKTVYMNDDPNDVSKECDARLCQACHWEWVND